MTAYTIARAEDIRDSADLSWDESLRIAQDEQRSCADLRIDFARYCEQTPAAVYAGRSESRDLILSFWS